MYITFVYTQIITHSDLLFVWSVVKYKQISTHELV